MPYINESVSRIQIYCTIFRHIRIIYVFFCHKYDCLSRRRPTSRSKRQACGVVSVAKCDFSGDAMQFCQGHTLVWVYCEFSLYFQGTSLWENLNQFFRKGIIIFHLFILKAHLHTSITVLSMTHRFLIFYKFY